jgi:ribosomal protein S18 acetylase RimI-like enzyme
MGRSTKGVIQELYDDHFVRIPFEGSSYFDEPMAKFNIIDRKIIDVDLFNYDEPIGYVNLKRNNRGYQVIGQWLNNHHPGFQLSNGIGIKVAEKYERRKIGQGLLSLGIGLAQLDHKERKANGLDEEFRVIANGITGSRGFWEKYGFEIIEFGKDIAAVYTDLESVPELNMDFSGL